MGIFVIRETNHKQDITSINIYALNNRAQIHEGKTNSI